ncbi:hypothetical protein B7Z28_01455 [Candidatus Saccharibacteria bacterium 32-45-3]|nr:MAG: hypothetical protein B7Z28_01455 [Candidatus Saccharibacteria bacterium 32-45-3]
MLFTSERFINTPVMSLQTGSEIAKTSRAIINPHRLTIAAYELEGRQLDYYPALLRVEDIREIGPIGMIVDSSDEIVGLEDILSLKDIYDLEFELINLKVVDEKKHSIGRVIGYTLEAGNFVIQQLRVKRPLIQSFGDTELLIHRSQIIEVTDTHVVVRSPKIRHTEPVTNSSKQVFENPFRKSTQPTTE